MRFMTSRLDLLSLVAVSASIALALPSASQAGTSNPDGDATVTQGVSYANDIVPILNTRCVPCHGGEDENGEILIEVGLNMTTHDLLMAGSEYGPIIEPGAPDASLMVEMIASGDMPLLGDPVLPVELELIRAWIAEGAANN